MNGAMNETMSEETVRISADDIVDWLAARIGERVGLAPGEIDIREPLATYGLSSTEGVVLSGDLEEWLGRDLPATLVWDYPTIERLARHLAAGPDGEGAP